MNLLKGFEERLRDLPPPKDAPSPLQRLRRSPDAYRGQTRYVDNQVDMEEVRLFLFQRDITHIGLDTEFRYTRPPVEIDKKRYWYEDKRAHGMDRGSCRCHEAATPPRILSRKGRAAGGGTAFHGHRQSQQPYATSKVLRAKGTFGQVQD